MTREILDQPAPAAGVRLGLRRPVDKRPQAAPNDVDTIARLVG